MSLELAHLSLELAHLSLDLVHLSLELAHLSLELAHLSLEVAQCLDSSSTYVKKQSVLPVRPQVEVVPSLSKRTRSGRKIVLQVENIDVIASMAKT